MDVPPRKSRKIAISHSKSQPKSRSKPVGEPDVWRAVTLAIAQQIVALVLAALVIAPIPLLRLAIIGTIGSWICILAILTRAIVARKTKPLTEVDLQIITYSFWLVSGLLLMLRLFRMI